MKLFGYQFDIPSAIAGFVVGAIFVAILGNL